MSASDQGEEPLSSSALIKVYVGDTNDNDPVFTEPIYYGSIDEHSDAGTTVALVCSTFT